MRGPKVIQHEIDRLDKCLSVAEKLHFMIARTLLNLDARQNYIDISEYRRTCWLKKRTLIREKKRAIRLKR